MPTSYTYWEYTEPPWDEKRVPWFVRLLVRWVIVAAAFLAAEWFVNNVVYERDRWFIDDWQALLWCTLIFMAVRATIRPVLMIMTCPLQLITLGLFAFVVDTMIVLLVEKLCDWLGIGFAVDGFWPAFVGALVISLVSFALTRVVRRQRFVR